MGELFTQREILENQDPAYLIALKAKKLEKLSDLEAEVHQINEVLDGYGIDPESSYRALGALGIEIAIGDLDER